MAEWVCSLACIQISRQLSQPIAHVVSHAGINYIMTGLLLDTNYLIYAPLDQKGQDISYFTHVHIPPDPYMPNGGALAPLRASIASIITSTLELHSGESAQTQTTGLATWLLWGGGVAALTFDQVAGGGRSAEVRRVGGGRR